jgi:hypothetical protein
MVNQKVGVTNAVLSLFPDYELNGEVILASLLTSEHKKQLRAILVEGFKAGEIAMTEKAQAKYLATGQETALNKYVSGLLDNWIRKNPEFNNKLKYITKNPGSRAGSGDDQVRAMRNLKKTTNDQSVIAEIDEAIAERLAEIKPTQTVEINVEALPEHLRKFVTTEE